MKIKNYKINLLYILLFFFSNIYAQVPSMLGPYPIYLSVQGSQPGVIYSGSYPASADEGRNIDVRIFDITGPIQVAPANYKLMGPVCPTYDSHGRRNPLEPAAPYMLNMAGEIIFAGAVPAAGDSVPASFKAKDFGYWTHCSDGMQHMYDTIVQINFSIISLKVETSSKNYSVCDSPETKVSVAKKVPSSGIISWKVIGDNVSLSEETQDYCKLKYIKKGMGKLVVTITVGTVSYSDTVTIKSGKIKFKKDIYDLITYKDGTIDLLSLLTDDSYKQNLEFWYGINDTRADKSDPILKLNDNPAGTNYPIYVYSKDFKADGIECGANARFRFWGWQPSVLDNPCDGIEANGKIVLTPAFGGTAAEQTAILSQVGNIVLKSATDELFKGNPGNKTELEFTAVQPDYTFKIKNGWWYSTQADNCNEKSRWKISGEGKINGQVAKSDGNGTVIVSSELGPCLNGWCAVSQTFTGEVTFVATYNEDKKRWEARYSAVGNFTRDPKGDPHNTANPKSQYWQMIEDEENYHKGQIEGGNGNPCAALWNRQHVIDSCNSVFYTGATKAIALANARSWFAKFVNDENTLSGQFWTLPSPTRCGVEAAAKAAVKSSYRGVMKCCYPTCP